VLQNRIHASKLVGGVERTALHEAFSSRRVGEVRTVPGGSMPNEVEGVVLVVAMTGTDCMDRTEGARQ
jgi:hypothetical protein